MKKKLCRLLILVEVAGCTLLCIQIWRLLVF